jgi:hypothetical protein
MRPQLTLLLVFLCVGLYSQEKVIFFNELSSLIEATNDSCTNKIDIDKIYFQKNDSNKYFIQYNFPKYIYINYSRVDTFEEFENYYSIACKYSLSESYFEKLFARDLFGYLLFTLHRNDLRILDIPFVEKKKYTELIFNRIIDKSRVPYLKYSLSTIRIPQMYISDSMMNNIGRLFANPYYTDYQAKVYINAYKSSYKTYKLNELINYQEINKWKVDAERANQTLDEFVDSLQNVENFKILNEIKNEIFIEIFDLIDLISTNHLTKFASSIEAIIPLIDTSKVDHAKLVLAKLKYKNYESEIIHTFSSQLNFLISDSTSNQEKIISKIDKIYRDLIFINTQNSFAAISPLLLCSKKVMTEFGGISYNRLVLKGLHSNIRNLPIDFDSEYKPIINYNKEWQVGDYLYDCEEVPISFFTNIYNWMLQNKGEYQIRSNSN